MDTSKSGAGALAAAKNDGRIIAIGADAYGLSASFGPNGSAPLIEITLDEQQRLLSTFTSLASSDISGNGVEELDIIPDFAMSATVDLSPTTAAVSYAEDGSSPADTLSTATSVSVPSLPPQHAPKAGPSLSQVDTMVYSSPRGGIYDTASRGLQLSAYAVKSEVGDKTAPRSRRRASPFVIEQQYGDLGSTPSR